MAEWLRSACPLNCWDTCTWMVRAKDGAVLEVKGDAEDPYTKGFLCPKALYQLERHNSPDRPLYPLRKKGERWERVSWDDALDLLSGQISQSIARLGTKSIFYYHDSGSMGLTKSLGLRLFRLLGPVTEPQGSLCWAAGIKAQQFDFGGYLAHAPEDILNSKFVVIWGRNPAVTNIHLIPILREAKKRGTRVALVDPIHSETSALADVVYSPRPGTDAALALSMANVILSKRLVDVPFVAAYCFGFDAFAESISAYTPSWAETETGIPAHQIEEFATEYAVSRPAAILMGYGFQRYAGGGQSVRACDALAAITGNIGLSGGGANYANGWISSQLKSLVPDYSPDNPPRFLPKTHFSSVGELDSPPVKVLIVSGANPVNQAPNSGAIARTLSRIPFKVVLDLRWTETASLSDLFLPVASPFEEEDLHYSAWHPRVTFKDQVVQPRGEAKPDRVIWAELAGRLGLGDSMDRSVEQWIDMALEPLKRFGLEAQGLKGKTVTFPVPQVPYADGRYATPSGKFEFLSITCLRETGHAVARYVPPLTSEDYPFRLLTLRGQRQLHSQFSEKTLPPDGIPLAIVGVESARESGLRDGDVAWVESMEGRILARIQVSDGMAKGTVLMYEGGSVLTGKGVNLLVPAIETDMGHGAAYYECFVRLLRAKGS